MKPFFTHLNLRYVFQTTKYAGHAEDLGVAFDSSLYDSVLFIRS